MELLFYIFIKPYVIVLETVFHILGRITETGLDLFLTFLLGIVLLLPIYYGSKKIKLKTKVWNILCYVLSFGIQITVCFSVWVFVREIFGSESENFGLISNLGQPDGLISIFGLSLNLLPVVYLTVSCVTLFLGNYSLFERIVIFFESVVTTLIIYNMPSSAALFWVMLSVCHILLEILVHFILKPKKNETDTVNEKNSNLEKADYYLFFSGLCFVILLSGFYIPSNIIRTSMQEFVDVSDMRNPLYYILFSMALSFGMFGIWGSIYYLLAGTKIKKVLEKSIWVIGCIASVDYIMSGSYQGEINSTLVYFEEKEFGTGRVLMSMVLAAVLSVILIILMKKKNEFANILVTTELAILVVSVVFNAFSITSGYRKMNYIRNEKANEECIRLSKNGKNVIIILADRALGPLVPFLFEEKPELIERFDGFTYYPNTISFAAYTNTGAPAAYGGYEYTPEALNARTEESLEQKHNEALKVLPVLFWQNNYEVTVIDPVYAGYNWIPDLSIFDDYSEIKKYRLEGKLKDRLPEDFASEKELLKRNFYCYSLMKMFPLNWQDMLYDLGDYCTPNPDYYIQSSRYTSDGYYAAFLDAYAVLERLSELTIIEDDEKDYFVSFYNSTPHMECLLQEPDYVPKHHVDNSPFHPDDEYVYYAGEKSLYMITMPQEEFYHVDMATFLKLGEWFDYLKENDCYDNTRIIIVSDHGADIENFNSVLDNGMDVENFMPVLMVKDFDAHGFTESDEMMTNADVAAIATESIIENRVNPFTGNLLDAHEKEEMDEYLIFYSEINNTGDNHGNIFKPGLWFSLKGNPYDLSNWSYLGQY